METLPFVSFILWSTGLSTAALMVLAIIDWRRNEQAQQTTAVRPVAVSRAQPKATAPATAQPALLKAA